MSAHRSSASDQTSRLVTVTLSVFPRKLGHCTRAAPRFTLSASRFASQSPIRPVFSAISGVIPVSLQVLPNHGSLSAQCSTSRLLLSFFSFLLLAFIGLLCFLWSTLRFELSTFFAIQTPVDTTSDILQVSSHLIPRSQLVFWHALAS